MVPTQYLACMGLERTRGAAVDATSPPKPVRIGVHDVGSRVVVRYRLAPDEHGPMGETLTDVVGELRTWGDGAGDSAGTATILRSSGELVSVPIASIVAGKVLPQLKARRGHNPPG